jgi:hypothetical protein
VAGQGRLEARWLRELPGIADGVVGLPAGLAGGARVVASGGGDLHSFDADGEVVARVKAGAAAGRLLDFGNSADGVRELAGFRPGGTAIGVIALRSGAVRTISVPAPLLDVAAGGDAQGDSRSLLVATMRGAARAAATDERAALIDGAATVRSLSAIPGRGVLALHEDGTIGGLDPSARPWAHPAEGADRLLDAGRDGAVAGPRTVIAAVSGRFLRDDGRQLAVATYAGHVALLDESSGRILFDAIWAGVHDLAASDLDGDGFDELLVASGRSVAALGAAAR